FLSYWLRMLLDINVKKGVLRDKYDISFADVVVTDLHLLIPNQQELQDFLDVEKNFWDEIGSLEVERMIAGIEYPAKANISIPARKWVATSSVEVENKDSRPLLRFPFSPSAGKLLDALRTGNDEFFKEWFSVLRSLAARTF